MDLHTTILTAAFTQVPVNENAITKITIAKTITTRTIKTCDEIPRRNAQTIMVSPGFVCSTETSCRTLHGMKTISSIGGSFVLVSPEICDSPELNVTEPSPIASTIAATIMTSELANVSGCSKSFATQSISESSRSESEMTLPMANQRGTETYI